MSREWYQNVARNERKKTRNGRKIPQKGAKTKSVPLVSRLWVNARMFLILTSISSVKWWGSGVRLEHFLSPPKKNEIKGFFGSSILQWSHFGCYIYVVLAWTPILQMILDYYLGPYMCWYIEPGSWFYRAPTDRYISKAHITDTIGRSADQCRRWLKRWQVALSKCLRNNSKESKRKQN